MPAHPVSRGGDYSGTRQACRHRLPAATSGPPWAPPARGFGGHGSCLRTTGPGHELRRAPGLGALFQADVWRSL